MSETGKPEVAHGRVGPFDDPDRYALTEMRSRGGEGELWLGSVDVSGQQLPVAVKVVTPSGGGSIEETSERLRTQAELLRSLDHPNLVKVREAFEGPEIHAEGAADSSTRTVYMVMNYVEGEDLATWVARNEERDVLQVTRIISRLAAAIDYLHRGEATGGTAVLHRDVKPANVIVGPDGSVRLVDFGFARFDDSDSMTLVGTPSYLAPEVVAGAPPGPASDRYGLGAVAYFLFTGESPNPADAAGMRARLLAVKGVEDKEGFADHVLAMVSRDPERRPTDVVAWAQGLAVGAVSQRFPTTPMGGGGGKKRGRRRLVGALMAAVLLLGGAAGAYAFMSTQDDSADASSGEDATADEDAGESDDDAAAEEEAAAGDGAEPAPSPTETPVEVPSVEGMSRIQAERELENAGLDVEVEYEASGEPADTVLEQDPPGGATDVDTVTLLVAEAPREIPQVEGERLSAALNTLEPLGIEVTTEDVLNEEVPDGQVVGQNPAAGEPFAEEVTLTVARQPVITFLADHRPVEGDADDTGTGNVSGDAYTRSVMEYVRDESDELVGYNLGRSYRELRATVGMRDDAPASGSAIVEVFGDGRSLFRESLTLGDAVPVSVDVTGVLRLELLVTNTSSTEDFYTVWGDIQVLGTQDEVPELEEDG